MITKIYIKKNSKLNKDIHAFNIYNSRLSPLNPEMSI
jgi:hypothetical protein